MVQWKPLQNMATNMQDQEFLDHVSSYQFWMFLPTSFCTVSNALIINHASVRVNLDDVSIKTRGTQTPTDGPENIPDSI
jgi:hypothetical protein